MVIKITKHLFSNVVQPYNMIIILSNHKFNYFYDYKSIRRNNMRNQDLRNLIRASNVRNWQVAEELGISDNTFYVLLRKKLNEEERTRIIVAIEKAKRQHHQAFIAETV
jgi:transcriptional regulator of acetoin/glycerol metabolism